MKAILIVLFALLACVVVIASCEHTIKTKLASKDSLVLESTNSNEDSIEFTFKSAEHFPMIGVKLVRQVPTSTNSSSSQQSSQSGSQSQQSGSQSSSQTTQPQPQASSGTGQMQQEQANATVSTSQQQQQQQSNSSSQAASQQSSQSSNQTQTVEKQDNPSAQSSSQAGSQGTSSTSQATTPQSSSGQNSTASSSSTSQSSQQGSSSSSQSTAQTSPVSQDNSSISGDSNMDLTPNTTQSSGQGSGSSSTGSEPANNSTTINNNTTLINETLQNIGVSNSTSKDVNITDVIGRIISGENITEIINSTLGNLTQWLNSTIDDNDNDNDNQSSQQQSKRGSLRRRLLSLLESNEESEDYAQYLKFNKLKLLSSEGETVKEIPLSDANIHWNYGHSVVVNNDQAFKVPHVDVELPLSSTSNRPTLKIRTMMTEAPSHIERNGRDIQLNPRSMDIQITLNNLHDLLSEQEKKLSGAKWSIETEMTSTANSLHLMQTKNLNSVQRVVVMGNNFAPKGQFTFNSSPNMKIIQNADNDDLISIQIQDSSNSIQLNPIKFGVH